MGDTSRCSRATSVALLHNNLLANGIDLQTALRENMKDERYPKFVNKPKIGQLCEDSTLKKSEPGTYGI